MAIDDSWQILKEYKKNLQSSGQPGVGSEFLIWVLTNKNNAARCEQVHLTRIGDAEDEFAEFPKDEALAKFDRADRKFVAVANSCTPKSIILQAVDFKWLTFVSIFRNHGIEVEFLCEQPRRN